MQFLAETSIVSEEDVFCPVEAFPAHKDPLGESMVKEESNLGKKLIKSLKSGKIS